jgi:hypothetical protein
VRAGHESPGERRGPGTASGGRELTGPRLHRLAAGDRRGPGHHAAAAAGLLEPDHAHPHPPRGRRVGEPVDGGQLRRPLRLRAARLRAGPGLPAARLRADERRLHIRVAGRRDGTSDGHLFAAQLELPADRERREPADRSRGGEHQAEPGTGLGAPGRQAGRRGRARAGLRLRARPAAAHPGRPAPAEGALPPGPPALPADPRAGPGGGGRRPRSRRPAQACGSAGARGPARGQGDAVLAHGRCGRSGRRLAGPAGGRAVSGGTRRGCRRAGAGARSRE